MKKIFLYCVPTGGGSGIVTDSTVGGDVMGFALAEDGECLASHLSSDKWFSQHDLGLTSDWKHDKYNAHYPDGFELEWVDDPDVHEGWARAFQLNAVGWPKRRTKDE